MSTRRLISTPSMANASGQIEIATGKLIQGKLPRRVLALVRQWRKLHIDELTEDWDLAQARKPLKTIEALE